MNKYIRYLENEIIYKERIISDLYKLKRPAATPLIKELEKEIIELQIILDKKSLPSYKKI